MPYKLDLRESVANLFGRVKTGEILDVFETQPISRRTIFRDFEEPENKKIWSPTKLGIKTTKKLLSGAKNKVGQ